MNKIKTTDIIPLATASVRRSISEEKKAERREKEILNKQKYAMTASIYHRNHIE